MARRRPTDPELVMLPLSELAHSKPRYAASDPYIAALADAYRLAASGVGEWPPPIIVHRGKAHVPINGYHRLDAARAARIKAVPALVSPHHGPLSAASKEQDRNRRFQRT